MQADALQLLLAPGLVLATLGEGHVEQGAVGGFFLGAGRLAQADGLALLEVGLHLVFDVLLESADDQALAAEVVGRVVVGVSNGRGVEQAHQRGKAARRAIMWRGREQHERVGPVGQQPRQPCAARQA